MQRNTKWLGIATGIVLAAVLATAGFAQALWSDYEIEKDVPADGGEVTQNLPVHAVSSNARTFNVYKAAGISGPDTILVPANATSVNLTVTLPPGDPNTYTGATVTETNDLGREIVNHDVVYFYSN